MAERKLSGVRVSLPRLTRVRAVSHDAYSGATLTYDDERRDYELCKLESVPGVREDDLRNAAAGAPGGGGAGALPLLAVGARPDVGLVVALVGVAAHDPQPAGVHAVASAVPPLPRSLGALAREGRLDASRKIVS